MNGSINRRDALKAGAAALAAASFVSTGLSADSPRKRAIKKAVMWGMIEAGNTVLEKLTNLWLTRLLATTDRETAMTSA